MRQHIIVIDKSMAVRELDKIIIEVIIENKETVLIEHDGEPQAIILPIEDYQRLVEEEKK